MAPPSSAADRAKKSAASRSPMSHSPKQYAGFMCALTCCTDTRIASHEHQLDAVHSQGWVQRLKPQAVCRVHAHADVLHRHLHSIT